MLMKKNLKTISITKTQLKIQNLTTMDQFYLFGDFQLRKVEESMLLLFVGILDIKIFSQLVMALMIF